jgi:hypothetical protein
MQRRYSISAASSSCCATTSVVTTLWTNWLGWSLLQGKLPLRERIMLVSGRSSYEIMQKSLARCIGLAEVLVQLKEERILPQGVTRCRDNRQR